MDLKKHLEFFNPTKIHDEIHIIGLGAIGSHVAGMLTRIGVDEMHIYDFDHVSQHNIANQMFLQSEADSHMAKTMAIEYICKAINPDIQLTIHDKGYMPGMKLSGYVFLAVDNIDLRRTIVEEHMSNPLILGMYDFRMGLTDAQHYAADWQKPESTKAFLNSMQFTHEEAKAEMPVSACGSTLNVIPTVQAIVSFGIANWMNHVRKGELKKIILVDIFNFTIDAF